MGIVADGMPRYSNMRARLLKNSIAITRAWTEQEAPELRVRAEKAGALRLPMSLNLSAKVRRMNMHMFQVFCRSPCIPGVRIHSLVPNAGYSCSGTATPARLRISWRGYLPKTLRGSFHTPCLVTGSLDLHLLWKGQLSYGAPCTWRECQQGRPGTPRSRLEPRRNRCHRTSARLLTL